jgi:hypothetical protein
VLADRAVVPRGWWRRALGLLLRAPLRPGEALWLPGCGSVLRVARGVRPWRAALAPRGTAVTVELPAGAAAAVRTGNVLELRPAPAAGEQPVCTGDGRPPGNPGAGGSQAPHVTRGGAAGATTGEESPDRRAPNAAGARVLPG